MPRWGHEHAARAALAGPARDEAPGRVVVLTRNPIAEAIGVIASTAGRDVVLVDEDEDGVAWPPSSHSGFARETRSCCATTTRPTLPPCCASRWVPRRRTSR